MLSKEIYLSNSLSSNYLQYSKEVKFAFNILIWSYRLKFILLAKRSLDLLLATSLLFLLSPIYAMIFVLYYKNILLKKSVKIGLQGKEFYQFTLQLSNTKNCNLLKKIKFDQFLLLLNVIKGDMTFVGPRAISIGEMDFCQKTVRRRLDVKPGIICLWWLRQQTSIDYSTEVFADLEYIEKTSLKEDLGILLRVIFSSIYGKNNPVNSSKLNILNIPIHNISMSEAIENIIKSIEKPTQTQVSFINADCVNRAYKNSRYLKVLQSSDICLADGIGMKLAGKLLDQPIKQNVNGTDMFPHLCKRLNGSQYKVFLLGGRELVAENVQNWIKEKYPNVLLAGCHHGYFNQEEEMEVIKKIVDSEADVLFVAMGAPKQEEWIAKNLPKTKAKVAIGVGGLFDFYSGRITRAPIWLREIGLEWLYRFYQEPSRMWQRYFIGNFVFMFRVLFTKYNLLP